MIDFNGFEVPKQNYSKLPHAMIDLLPIIDTVAELKCVLYVLRHTWGFSEYGLPKKITTDEFANGRKRRDGSRIDNGTGLSEPSIRAGLEKAVEHKILLVDADDRDAGRKKRFYSLNIVEAPIDDGVDAADDEEDGEKLLPPAVKDLLSPQKTLLSYRERNPLKYKKTLSAQEEQEAVQEAVQEGMDAFTKFLEFEAAKLGMQTSGKAWRGRELLPPNLVPYGDWWYSKTNLEMYSAKGKAKLNLEWQKAFREWWENDVTLATLNTVYEAEKAWKGIISKPSELTTKAKALQVLPPPPAEQKPSATESPLAAFEKTWTPRA